MRETLLSRVLYLGRERFPNGADHYAPSLNECFAYYDRSETETTATFNLPSSQGSWMASTMLNRPCRID